MNVINKQIKILMSLALLSLASCTAPVDPEKLYISCTTYLEKNFIDENDSADTRKGLLQKMTLACERARTDCQKSPDGKNCQRHVKKYK